MSVELVCAKCGKPGGLSEELTVESDGYRSVKVEIVDGAQKITKGPIEKGLSHDDITGTGSIICSHCQVEFSSIDEATAQEVREHRCAECGWWGLQDWLHPIERPDCAGELTKHRIGSTELAAQQAMDNGAPSAA